MSITSDNIRALRKANKLTQDELASIIGNKKHNVGAWEEGRAMPSVEILTKICSLFKISIEDLTTKNLARNNIRN